MLKQTVILSACLAALAFSDAVAGDIQKPLAVVELFTSQGCASCPPADKAAAKLADDGNVIMLSYHVDYWNYLGWADTMSSPENTKRQYDYSAAMGRSGVYTPQAVINGRAEMVGTGLGQIRDSLASAETGANALSVPITMKKAGDEVVIDIGAGEGKADVLVVYFKSHEQVTIKAGENKDKTLDYRNIVTDVQTVGMWHGEPDTITLPARVLDPSESDGCAILLQTTDQNGNPGAILGATLMTNR